MKLCESQFICLTTWVCSLCSPCSLVHKDFNEAFWISIHLTKYLSLFTLFTCSLVLKDLNEALWISIHLTNYLSLFTLFTLFTCSQGFQWSFLNLNSFGEVFEFVHFVHLVHLFLMIWMKLSESQFIWPSIWVSSLCSPCSLVLDDLNEALWISIHLTNYLCLFTLFTHSRGFEWRFLNLNSYD